MIDTTSARLGACGKHGESAMEFSAVVQKRRMVRNFTEAQVDAQIIDRILNLARHAPSAGFTQGQSFVVVTRPDLKRAIADLCGEAEYVARGFHPFVSGAPVLIVPCTSEAAYHRRYQERDKLQADGAEIEWPVPYWHMDIGCAVMIVLLAAVDEGLAAGFAGAHDLDALRAVLNIPVEVMPVGVIPIGHPAPDTPSPSLKRGRKPDVEYVHREEW
jgi:nitroreductase